jgi:hypothetical protein
VARPSKFGNPYRLGHTQVRIPALDGSEWEIEGRLYKTSGERHPYNHADGRYTWHAVEDATQTQVVEAFRALVMKGRGYPTLDEIRAELAGFDLACWCRIGDPCHADVLLVLANT